MSAYTYALVERAKAAVALLKSDRKGVTALEYGLLAAVIALVMVVGAATLGTSLSAAFTNIAASI